MQMATILWVSNSTLISALPLFWLSYPVCFTTRSPQLIHRVEVPSDSEGLNSSALEKTLREWPPNKRQPRVLYTVPTGSNPTGRTCTEKRKMEV